LEQRLRMFTAPNPTGYDLRFSVAKIPVRVHPLFWLATFVFGWDLFQLNFVEFVTGQPTELPLAVFLALWVAAMFLSILIHEMGHVLAYRYFGISSHIILYLFGGLAVADSWGTRSRIDPWNQLVISLAGPVAQWLLAGVVMLLVLVAGHALPVRGTILQDYLPTSGEPIPSVPLQMFVLYLLVPSIFWALLNLLPIFPLDGGRIAESLLLMKDPYSGTMQAKWLSVFVGGGLAALMVYWDMKSTALLFGILALSNFMELRGMGGGGGGYGNGNYGGGGYGGGRW
jgi:Zn-dependent protease